MTNQVHRLSDLSLFFHIIATSLYTFLPAFWEFENSPSVKFRSSHPKTLMHCFPNCLRCLITLSAQLILHKSEKMVVGGCQIRTIGGVWKNFPPHLCNCCRCEASVVMQGDDVSSRTFITQCTTELVQCVNITSSSDGLPRFQEFGQNQPSASQKTVPITFAADGTVFAFFFDGECKWHHSILCRFVSGSKW